MATGYLAMGKASETATFDLYYRRNPFKGGYSIAAGLEAAVHAVAETKFSEDDLGYLRSLSSSAGSPTFSKEFLRYLASYKFSGTLGRAGRTVVFRMNPSAGQRQFDRMPDRQTICCATSISDTGGYKGGPGLEAATMAPSSIRPAAGSGSRRSAGACRATYQDVFSSRAGAAWFKYRRGAHAHSWIQAFASNRAFRSYASSFPDDCILLVDTYDL
jgi:nicotinate phosphoribosyltransferase